MGMTSIRRYRQFNDEQSEQDKKNNEMLEPFEPVGGEKEEEKDFSEMTEAQLKRVTNDDLKAYLDEKGTAYDAEATKADLIKLVKGE